MAPKWGLYANMIAQLISQISSHYIIHYHRKVVDEALNRHIQTQLTALESEDGDDDSVKKSPVGNTRMIAGRPTYVDSAAVKLCDHAFRRRHRGESDKLVPRRIVRPLLWAMVLLLSIFVLLGTSLPSYSVNILGIAGVLVESGQGFTEANTSYSVFTTMKMLFDQAALTGSARDYIGLGTLSTLVVLSVVFVPVAQSVALLVQWLVPLTQIRRHRLSVALEILQAWQYAEVYLLAILVASWQLGPISSKFVVIEFLHFKLLFESFL